MFEYRALIVSVYDGDTVRADIDIGFSIWKRNEPLRLYGINTPEVTGIQKPEGLKSKAALVELIEGKTVIIKTEKDRQEKYGRYLATIFLERGDGTILNVNQYLIEQKFAVPYFGEGKVG